MTSSHNGISRLVAESMTADELSNAQAEHYNLDDSMRRMMGKMTVEQKAKVAAYCQSILSKED